MESTIIGILGLKKEEIELIKKNLPHKNCEIMDTDDVRDIIAVNELAVIINTEAVPEEDMKILYDFYGEIAPFSETVVCIGKDRGELPENIQRYINVYECFDNLKDNLKYVLLSAYKKNKKTENFSSTLANTITILSLIRQRPYITSAELAKKLEMSQRSVQRYIETLRVAGEWIEYDTEKKGWTLQAGKSVLWGDFE